MNSCFSASDDVTETLMKVVVTAFRYGHGVLLEIRDHGATINAISNSQ
jgi:hypothetical protein